MEPEFPQTRGERIAAKLRSKANKLSREERDGLLIKAKQIMEQPSRLSKGSYVPPANALQPPKLKPTTSSIRMRQLIDKIEKEASSITCMSYEYDPTPTGEERLANIVEMIQRFKADL